MGATAGEIVLLLSKEIVKWVLLANLIAWPCGLHRNERMVEEFLLIASMSV